MSVLDLDRRTLADVIATLEGERDCSIRRYAAGRITWSLRDREAYSYGSHFPLFRMLEAPGPRGRRARYLLNGERWPGVRSRTSDHQGIVRDLLAGAETLILPFGALLGAGIDLDSIRALDVQPDQWHEVERTARALAEMPVFRRTESYSVDCEAPSLEFVPERYRKTYRERTAEELEALETPGGTVASYMQYGHNLPLLADADGLYRWTESRTRTVSPDDDGLYRWTERIHSLGESVFSAVRAETVTRPARPFEAPSETRARTVELEVLTDGRFWRGYCSSAESDRCESGPAGACVHCGGELRARVTTRRRARYLSGFDTNENPALYFLCELPRGAGATVEQAREALAPRAVHAALARGIEVRRQGSRACTHARVYIKECVLYKRAEICIVGSASEEGREDEHGAA